MSRIVAYVLALALSSQVVSAAELKLPISAAYGSPAGCFHFSYGGEQAVLGGGYRQPPEGTPEGSIVISPRRIVGTEMRCTPFEVSGPTALLECGAVDVEWTARATFVESGGTLTFWADFVSGDLHLLMIDSWPPETYGKCVFDEKG